MTWSLRGPADRSGAGARAGTWTDQRNPYDDKPLHDPPSIGRGPRWALLTLAACLPLAGCSALGMGDASPTTTAAPTGLATVETLPPSPTPTTTTPGGGMQSVATMSGGNGSARVLVLGDKAVPPGWKDSTPRETGGYRMTVCGVDLEPSAPIDGAQKRWQNGPSGPFLEEHVRVYSDRTAAGVVAQLKRAVPTCRGYTVSDAGGSATYSVEQLKVAGADAGFVTWRQRLRLPAPQPASSSTAGTETATGTAPASPAATAAPRAPVLVQDVAVTRRGSSVVLLASYAIDQVPQPQVLATAVRALGKSR